MIPRDTNLSDSCLNLKIIVFPVWPERIFCWKLFKTALLTCFFSFLKNIPQCCITKRGHLLQLKTSQITKHLLFFFETCPMSEKCSMTLPKYCSLHFSFFRPTVPYFLKKLRLTTFEDMHHTLKTIHFFCSSVKQFILSIIFNIKIRPNNWNQDHLNDFNINVQYTG